MKYKKPAFTLLEILVVMAIIAILLFMLVQVMAIFRRNVELQQASDQIVSRINETKNYSTNNILPDDLSIESDSIYAYRLMPQVNNIQRKVCQKRQTSLNWDCAVSTSEEYLIADFMQNIVITADGCDSLLLINLINDWQIGNSGAYSDDSQCKLELAHKEDLRVYRTFVFNGLNNTFEFEYGTN